MLVLYYPPFRAADDAELLGMTVTAITAYVEELSRFDEDRITRAWADVRSRHRTQGWPVLGIIVDACGDGPGSTGHVSSMDKRKREEEAINSLLHNVLYSGPLGRQAAEQGWAYELKIFLERNACTPNPSETEHMKRGYDRAAATMAEMEYKAAAGEEILGMASLRSVFKHMPVREANLAEKILNRAAA